MGSGLNASGLGCLRSTRRSNSAELRKVMQQMAQIVLHQKPQSHGLTGTNAASCSQLSWRQVGDDMGKVAIVACPQGDEGWPRRFFNSLNTHPTLLVITGKVERTLQCGSHKPLMVVRGRINQMSEDLLR